MAGGSGEYQETTPGTGVLTAIYLALFLLYYLWLFYNLSLRWEIS